MIVVVLVIVIIIVTVTVTIIVVANISSRIAHVIMIDLLIIVVFRMYVIAIANVSLLIFFFSLDKPAAFSKLCSRISAKVTEPSRHRNRREGNSQYSWGFRGVPTDNSAVLYVSMTRDTANFSEHGFQAFRNLGPGNTRSGLVLLSRKGRPTNESFVC